MTTTTTATIPVFDDDNQGVDHVVLTVRAGELTADTLLVAMQALIRARVPITLNFSLDGPPPLFVTVTQAARALGVTTNRIEAMIRTGWLNPVYWANDEAETKKRYMTSLAVATDTGDYTGWLKRIPYPDILEVAQHALKVGHLPGPKTRKPGSAEGKPAKTKRTRVQVSAIAYTILRDAVHPDTGEHQWMSLADIHALTEEAIWKQRPSQVVPFNTVQSAIVGTGVRSGFIKRRTIGYRALDRKAKMEFRWASDPDELMERPEGGVQLRPVHTRQATEERLAAIRRKMSDKRRSPVELLNLAKVALEYQEDLLAMEDPEAVGLTEETAE